jgi:membrane associated rhomboid family serine protease
MGFFMTQTTFGRRGVAPRISPYRSAAPVVTPEPSTELLFDNSERLMGALPVFTAGIILLLWVFFALEKSFAFDVGKGVQMSARSLTALGAASRELVIGQHQFWRLFLAPLMHNGVAHIFGNSIALALLGYFLEIRVGRGWFLAVFFLSALTGGLGSMIGNPPEVVTVGASGAISGLLGAVFVLSFHVAFDREQNRAMRRMALRFAVPALAPLLYGAHGHTDYYAHLGGAIGGALLGLFLLANWSGESYRPAHGKIMGAIAAMFLVGSIIGVGFVVKDYARSKAESDQFIPLTRMPEKFDAAAKDAPSLLRRYPNDPRSHLFAAQAAIRSGDGFAAERELRSALTLSTEQNNRPLRFLAKAFLAGLYADRHDWRQTNEYAAEICDKSNSAPEAGELRRLLVKSNICS